VTVSPFERAAVRRLRHQVLLGGCTPSGRYWSVMSVEHRAAPDHTSVTLMADACPGVVLVLTLSSWAGLDVVEWRVRRSGRTIRGDVAWFSHSTHGWGTLSSVLDAARDVAEADYVSRWGR